MVAGARAEPYSASSLCLTSTSRQWLGWRILEATCSTVQYQYSTVQYSTSTGEPWTGGYLKEGLELVRAVRRHSVQGLPQLAEGGLQLGLGEHLGGKYYHFQQKIF